MTPPRALLRRHLGPALCLVMLFTAVSAAQDFRIVPGERVGKVKLGMERQTVHALLGEPASSVQESSGVLHENWVSRKDGLSVLFRADKVISIEVTSPRFKTRNGISTRTSLARIKRLYKNLKETTWVDTKLDTKLIYYDSVAQGITFGRVAPNSPDKSYKFSSLIIHVPGVAFSLKD